jgi:nucleolar protein 58
LRLHFLQWWNNTLCIQVNEEIVVAASTLFNYDAAMEEEYPSLRTIGRYLKDVSDIDCKIWDALQLVNAFKIICTHEIGNSNEVNHTM